MACEHMARPPLLPALHQHLIVWALIEQAGRGAYVGAAAAEPTVPQLPVLERAAAGCVHLWLLLLLPLWWEQRQRWLCRRLLCGGVLLRAPEAGAHDAAAATARHAHKALGPPGGTEAATGWPQGLHGLHEVKVRRKA